MAQCRGTAAPRAALIHLCREEELPPQPWGCAVLQGGTGGPMLCLEVPLQWPVVLAHPPQGRDGGCVPLGLLWVFGCRPGAEGVVAARWGGCC